MSTINYSTLSSYYSDLAKSTKTFLQVIDDNKKEPRTLGLVTGFSIMQDPDVRRVYEIGSLKPKLASGIVPVRFTISKLVGVATNSVLTALMDIFNIQPSETAIALSEGHFTKPVDFQVVFRNDKDEVVRTLKISKCVLASDGMFVNAGDTFIMENLSFEAAAVEEI